MSKSWKHVESTGLTISDLQNEFRKSETALNFFQNSNSKLWSMKDVKYFCTAGRKVIWDKQASIHDTDWIIEKDEACKFRRLTIYLCWFSCIVARGHTWVCQHQDLSDSHIFWRQIFSCCCSGAGGNLAWRSCMDCTLQELISFSLVHHWLSQWDYHPYYTSTFIFSSHLATLLFLFIKQKLFSWEYEGWY